MNGKNTTDNETVPVEAVASKTASLAEMNELRGVIRHGNRRWKRLVLLEALGLAIAAPLAYLWVILALDSLLYLSVAGRLLAALLLLGAVIWQGRRLWKSWLRARFSDDQVALAMEQNTPGGLENRLINSIQLASGNVPARGEIHAAVIRENCRQLRRHHVEQAARTRPAMLRIGLAALVVMTGLAFRAIEPERFSISATRILLPFANVTPLYRTRLTVEPGNVDALPGDDVRIEVGISGRIPKSLQIISRYEGEHITETIPIPNGSRRVVHEFTNLRGPLNYAVRGGDYETPFFLIQVPVPSELERLRVTYRYPEYTGRPVRVQDGTGAEIQGVYGTEARLEVFVNQPTESAALVFFATPENTASTATNAPQDPESERLELTRESEREFSGTLHLRESSRYRIETRRSGHSPTLGPPSMITALPDQAPELQLEGIEDGAEVGLDAVLTLDLAASDDFGLTAVGIFRRMENAEDAEWVALGSWTIDPAETGFNKRLVVPVGALGAAEGDALEIAPRGRDNNPRRGESWHTGERRRISIGSESSRLQLQYERILETEASLEQMISQTLDLSDKAMQWIRKLDSGSNLRWDDQENLDQLNAGMSALAETQARLRSLGSETARNMPEEAGNLKLSVAMLADTEMIRSIQMIERVPDRESPGDKRSALGEARLTQERTLRSLREILTAFVAFRKDWELENMIPFTRMLAERQAAMAEMSTGYAELSSETPELIEPLQKGALRRQEKVRSLAGLAGKAFAGMAERTEVVGEVMSAAFAQAAASLSAKPLQDPMLAASRRIEAGDWIPASRHQASAAGELRELYQRLRQAQADFARRMMEQLRELAEDSPEAQAEIDRLKEGYSEQLMYGANIETMADIVHMAEKAEEIENEKFENRADGSPSAEGELADYISTHVSGSLMPDEERDFSIMTLASRPGSQMELIPGFETDDTMQISVLQSYEDIVGPLLEEADDIREEFDSIVNMLLGQDIEAGDSGKGGHGMASVSAAAPTGNQKPDTHEHGGASRIGRQGARAHGIAVGSESISRRGRDKAQEGSQEVPDVDAAPIQETLSDDPAPDHSTGVGGREVEGEMQRTFSLQDAGEWDDSMTERMKAPQSAHQIVERAGGPLDPEVADRLRDLDNHQEQLIERIKRVKKELDNLYLPTDHLDAAMRELRGNLERLRDTPEPEAFKTQMESIDKLIGAVMVFDRPSSEFQPSLPRTSVLRGDILDEPPGPTLPGYETAVKRYYERLSNP